jgi:PAS domain-containing protein
MGQAGGHRPIDMPMATTDSEEQRALTLIVEQTAHVLSAPWSCAWLVDEAGTLRPVAVRTRLGGVRPPSRLRRHSLAARVALSGQVTSLGDATQSPAWRRGAFSERTGLRAFLGAPVAVEWTPVEWGRPAPKLLGLLEVLREPQHPFTPAEEQLLASIAQVAGAALSSACRLAAVEQFAAALAENAAQLVRSAAAEIVRLEQRLEDVLACVPAAVFELDTDGVFLRSGCVGQAVLGVPIGDLVGRRIWDIYQDRPGLLDDARRALAGAAFQSREHVSALGRTYALNWMPLRDAQGHVLAVRGVAVEQLRGPDVPTAANRERALLHGWAY